MPMIFDCDGVVVDSTRLHMDVHRPTPDASGTDAPLSDSELKTLHAKLAALRAEDEQHATKPKKQKSIRALLAYAACDNGVNEEVIRSLVEQELGSINEHSLMGGDYYNAVVDFLGNLDLKKFLN